jgi:hypothetical protein
LDTDKIVQCEGQLVLPFDDEDAEKLRANHEQALKRYFGPNVTVVLDKGRC